MNMLSHIARYLFGVFTIAAILLPVWAFAYELPELVDDFSHQSQNSLGVQRQFMNDTVAGGSSESEVTVQGGKIHLTGNLIPPRGQPAWASSILLLDAKGKPMDASGYQGIRLKVKINQGLMSVSANSAEVENFDYHAAPVLIKADGKFHEVKLPFTSLKRAWSEQTTLDASTLNSLSIVAFAMQQSAYDFVIDEIGFY
ncbi:MAG: CIA30 family protein [Pseudomonadota bacterium]|nr:CIA30 family protein [Alteromonas alba]MDY6928581.1 CIA30 family protein [Pseudomonadota bacterium]